MSEEKDEQIKLINTNEDIFKSSDTLERINQGKPRDIPIYIWNSLKNE